MSYDIDMSGITIYAPAGYTNTTIRIQPLANLEHAGENSENNPFELSDGEVRFSNGPADSCPIFKCINMEEAHYESFDMAGGQTTLGSKSSSSLSLLTGAVLNATVSNDLTASHSSGSLKGTIGLNITVSNDLYVAPSVAVVAPAAIYVLGPGIVYKSSLWLGGRVSSAPTRLQLWWSHANPAITGLSEYPIHVALFGNNC
ncbi:hypothetical protein KFU94_01230 [Chloroflexi bacterium TSY]|nr:hypothetical protein [Chloroflexi bacterium TSY]